MEKLTDLTHADLARMVDCVADSMRQECAHRLREMSVMQDKLEDAVRQVNDAERTLQRYDSALDAITQLAWPECTDVQTDAADYLTKLVVKVGVLARVTANDSQAWDVLRKHVRANHALSKLAVQQRDELRHLEAERLTLAARVVELEEHLEVATTAYSELRTRLTPRPAPVDVDANGSHVVELKLAGGSDV